MNVLLSLEESSGLQFPIVTIGNFDGLHLGHQAVLRLMKARAQTVGGTVVVLTFDPHPLRILAPHVDLQFLSDPEEKLTLLKEAGVGAVVHLPFTQEFAAQSPEEFMKSVLVNGLGTRELYIGQNFRFGRNREGTIHTLLGAGPSTGFAVHPISPVVLNGIPVSSTRIRALIQAGSVAEAATLLGRPYTLRGKVIKGEGRGKDLGYPTANLSPPHARVLPSDGVYATHLQWNDKVFPGVTYVGKRPTFGEERRLIETYLLEGGHNLYDQEISVALHDRLRDDMVFQNPDQLTQQIAADVARTKTILRNLLPLKVRVGASNR